jgi:HEAT repeat protein
LTHPGDTHHLPLRQPPPCAAARTRRRRRRCRWFLAAAAAAAAACAGDADSRRREIPELERQRTAEGVARLRVLAADRDRDVRATALDALIGLDVGDSVPLARAALDDPDGFVRATGAKLLGELADPQQAPALADVLAHDPEPIPRQRAAEALAALGGETVLASLAAGLADPAERVRLACVDGLGALDPLSALEGLLHALAEDPSWEVRARAARALGPAADPAARAGLEAALEDPNESVRSAAAEALAVHGRLRAEGGSGPGGV